MSLSLHHFYETSHKLKITTAPDYSNTIHKTCLSGLYAFFMLKLFNIAPVLLGFMRAICMSYSKPHQYQMKANNLSSCINLFVATNTSRRPICTLSLLCFIIAPNLTFSLVACSSGRQLFKTRPKASIFSSCDLSYFFISGNLAIRILIAMPCILMLSLIRDKANTV